MQPVKEKITPANRVESQTGESQVPLTLLMVSLVVLVTVIGYWQVLFNFFLGDDFVHLTWLKDAVVNPELIWRNFHSSWLDGTTTRFYRPLISVFMVTDYLGWHTNGLGFHITNLLFHLWGTIMLFFTSRRLLGAALNHSQREPYSGRGFQASLYSFGTSLLFGLYPLHCESVSWITGRVDAVVTAFYITSLYCYLRWRQDVQCSKIMKATWLALTILALALGLLSKEMALTLPPAFVLYELFLGRHALFTRKKFEDEKTDAHADPQQRGNASNAPSAGSKPAALISQSINIVKPTIIFWLLLVIYFAVRRMALGTFVGGYDDSLFFIADVRQFVLGWLHGLRMFIVPLNKNLMGSHNAITIIWQVAFWTAFGMAAINVVRERALFRLLCFNGLFMALCFAPVYKIFAIADDLQASRLAHVATVALCLFIGMAFIVLEPERRLSKDPNKDTGSTSSLNNGRLNALWRFAPVLQTVLLITFGSVALSALWTNNSAWARAGRESNAIRAGLSKLYTDVSGDPQVLLIGLPDQMDGAYISRNALYGMTKSPQMQRDVQNCLMLNPYEQILPFGFLKESLWNARDSVKLYFWDTKAKEFKPLNVAREPVSKTVWAGSDLKEIIKDKNGKSHWTDSGELEIQGNASKDGRPELLLDFGRRSCFDLEFVKLHLRNLDTTNGAQQYILSEGADLLYTNDLRPDFDLPNRTHAELNPDLQSEDVILPLHNLPEWSLGGKAHALDLKLPHNRHFALDSVELVSAEQLIPSIAFDNSGYLGTKGYLHISNKVNKATVRVDGTKIKDASSIALEITRPNLMFENQNTNRPSKVSMKELKGELNGQIILRREDFPATGIYEARPWAVDASGHKLGVAGDHIVISVDS